MGYIAFGSINFNFMVPKTGSYLFGVVICFFFFPLNYRMEAICDDFAFYTVKAKSFRKYVI